MTAVFITGATSGIGKQLALDYAKQGWQVIACGRNQSVLDSLHTQYANIFPLAFDVTDHPGTKAALAQLPCQPELWILNAGDCEYIDDGKMDVTLMARVFNINVLGVAAVIEGIQPHLSRGHRVAIVGSIASELALPRAEAYGASKAGRRLFSTNASTRLASAWYRSHHHFSGLCRHTTHGSQYFCHADDHHSRACRPGDQSWLGARCVTTLFP